MRTTALVCAVWSVLTACSSDHLTSPTAEYHPGRGVTPQGTAVAADFTVTLPGSTVYRESGPGNNGKGECQPGGRWYNPQNRQTSQQPHDLCASTNPGVTFVVGFHETATYVDPLHWNVRLSFSSNCSQSPVAGCGRGVQYNVHEDRTVGFGTLQTLDAEGRVWTIDLEQPLLNGDGNLLVPSGTSLFACNEALGCFGGLMRW
jgi:hypothetical protein